MTLVRGLGEGNWLLVIVILRIILLIEYKITIHLPSGCRCRPLVFRRLVWIKADTVWGEGKELWLQKRVVNLFLRCCSWWSSCWLSLSIIRGHIDRNWSRLVNCVSFSQSIFFNATNDVRTGVVGFPFWVCGSSFSWEGRLWLLWRKGPDRRRNHFNLWVFLALFFLWW